MVAPTGVCAVFDILFVGTDVLGVPYARRNVTLGSLPEGAFLLVGLSVKFAPQTFSADPYRFV